MNPFTFIKVNKSLWSCESKIGLEYIEVNEFLMVMQCFKNILLAGFPLSVSCLGLAII